MLIFILQCVILTTGTMIIFTELSIESTFCIIIVTVTFQVLALTKDVKNKQAIIC